MLMLVIFVIILNMIIKKKVSVIYINLMSFLRERRELSLNLDIVMLISVKMLNGVIFIIRFIIWNMVWEMFLKKVNIGLFFLFIVEIFSVNRIVK